MKIQIHNSSAPRQKSAAGYTIMELTVAVAAGTVVLLGIAGLTIFTSWSYQAATNYADLDNQSRIAEDVLGKEIRNAYQLVSASSNNPAYLLFTNTALQTSAQISFDTNAGTLTLLKYSSSGTILVTNLTGCDQWSYAIYNRALITTNNDIFFNTPTNFADCKIINMTWKCSRKILGSKRYTESVQTAQIVLRNQVSK